LVVVAVGPLVLVDLCVEAPVLALRLGRRLGRRAVLVVVVLRLIVPAAVLVEGEVLAGGDEEASAVGRLFEGGESRRIVSLHLNDK
jgi:hypothetical protein